MWFLNTSNEGVNWRGDCTEPKNVPIQHFESISAELCLALLPNWGQFSRQGFLFRPLDKVTHSTVLPRNIIVFVLYENLFL